MGYAINSCTLSGHVQRGPQYGVSSNGTKWAKFTLRVNDRQYNPITHQIEDTLQFIDCLAFNDDVDFLKENGLTVHRHVVGTFTLRMEPRTITDSGTNKTRILTVPLFIVKSGQIELDELPKSAHEWHSTVWDTQADL